jgi:putative heme iron utilization protein
MTSDQTQQLLASARRLWLGSFQGVLSTHSAAHPGYPFGTLVPFCLGRDGLPLLLLSHLAQHCRNLLENPACGLLLSQTGNGDVQQLSRLSLVADCRAADELGAAEAERYFRYFPPSRIYFEQLNFRFFRLRPRHFHLNAGFAAARWLGAERLVDARDLDPETETDLRARVEREQPLLRRLGAADENRVEVAGLDSRGMDLRFARQLRRVEFPFPVHDPRVLHTAIEEIKSQESSP